MNEHVTQTSTRPSVARIAQASAGIDPVFLNTPQFEVASLSAQVGCRVVVKVETLNPIGSFKGRGACFMVGQLSGRAPVVCATAGNFGLGMAYAARLHGSRLTVFTSVRANPIKVERMRALGAEVFSRGIEPNEARRAAREFAAECGALLVEDGRDVAISEGAGTIAVELLRWRELFDFIVVPLGDGALLGGVGCWVKAHSPAAQVIGVCAAGAPAMQLAWRKLSPGSSESTRTIAEGLTVQSPFPEAVEALQGVVDDILVVEDEALVRGMRLAHAELGLVLEPSGAAGLAALLAHGDRFRGARVATVLTGGGSLPADQLREWLGV